jgi:hypothetical protein
MNRSFTPAAVVCALAGACVIHAQDAPPAYVPLTLEQQYSYSMNKAIGGPGLALVMIKSSFDQLRDTPNQWGSSGDSFAVRTASRFGRSFLRQNIGFGVRALDGEDPRYFPLGTGTKWTRTKYAMGHTFAVRNSSGNYMPAYSLLAADFGTPFLSNKWLPAPYTTPHEVRIGALAVGLAVGSHVFQEFWPDLRKKVPARFLKGPLTR